MVSDTVSMTPDLLSCVLHSCLMTQLQPRCKNRKAPHLMAESGAHVPGCQIVKVVVMTNTPVTLRLELHYPCQPTMKIAEPRFRRPQEVIASCNENGKQAGMTMFYTG
jgi:hypothetical protein